MIYYFFLRQAVRVFTGTIVVTFIVKHRVGPLFVGLDVPHYEASCNQFTPKLHALNQVQKFHYLLHVSIVGSL